ncbi:MAG TPA: TetR family transcriptional regulator [Iamia sp.]|nr:TetR family transcriptional regulator [Iamia sp.]
MARRTAEDAARTRRDLLDAATRLFVDEGFGTVTVDAIATAAGVTRGALYHHFPDGKPGLFDEIYRDELVRFDAEMTAAGIRAAEETGDLWEALWAGTDRYLELCTGPVFARIAIYEAPAALGYDRWEELDTEFSVAQFKGILTLLMAAGEIAEEPIEPLARVLVGAFNMAARQIAIAEDTEAAVRDYGRVLRTLVATAAGRPDRQPD